MKKFTFIWYSILTNLTFIIFKEPQHQLEGSLLCVQSLPHMKIQKDGQTFTDMYQDLMSVPGVTLLMEPRLSPKPLTKCLVSRAASG